MKPCEILKVKKVLVGAVRYVTGVHRVLLCSTGLLYLRVCGIQLEVRNNVLNGQILENEMHGYNEGG